MRRCFHKLRKLRILTAKAFLSSNLEEMLLKEISINHLEYKLPRHYLGTSLFNSTNLNLCTNYKQFLKKRDKK